VSAWARVARPERTSAAMPGQASAALLEAVRLLALRLANVAEASAAQQSSMPRIGPGGAPGGGGGGGASDGGGVAAALSAGGAALALAGGAALPVSAATGVAEAGAGAAPVVPELSSFFPQAASARALPTISTRAQVERIMCLLYTT
jgi:hypothetical protein